jgi:hypothetical protein
MKIKKIISPENLDSEKDKNFLYRHLPGFLKRIYNKLQIQYFIWKYRAHADSRELNWSWKTKNYNRVALVNLLVGKFHDAKYLEIGCAGNYLFNSVFVNDKTGVDPSSGGNIRKTSDDFFKSNKMKYDVIFIDGLHTYGQVKRDVINSIRNIKTGGYILLHDMLPGNWKEQHIPILTRGSWTGDVWKVGFELAQTEGLEFKILKIDYGVGVIRVVDKNINLVDFSKKLENKEFSYFYDNLKKLPLIDWSEAQKWLYSK